MHLGVLVFVSHGYVFGCWHNSRNTVDCVFLALILNLAWDTFIEETVWLHLWFHFDHLINSSVHDEICSLMSVVNFNFSSVNISPEDPQWVGAWWIGFLISGTLAFLLAIPLSGFPRSMPGFDFLVPTFLHYCCSELSWFKIEPFTLKLRISGNIWYSDIKVLNILRFYQLMIHRSFLQVLPNFGAKECPKYIEDRKNDRKRRTATEA